MHLIFIGLLVVVGGVAYAVSDHLQFKGPLTQAHPYQQYPGDSSTPAEGGANNIRSMR